MSETSKINRLIRVFDTEPFLIEDSNAPWTNLIKETYNANVYQDAYPVTEGHLLFVPKNNSPLTLVECFEDAVMEGILRVKEGEWDGFNVGMNYGPAAGQTVPWPHIHLIPRRHGDMEDPTGGVRHVIPERGNYRKW